jgi:hypothetical protein
MAESDEQLLDPSSGRGGGVDPAFERTGGAGPASSAWMGSTGWLAGLFFFGFF